MSTLYILYGSATGNAEGIAKDLSEKQMPAQFSSVVCKPMDQLKKLLPEWAEPPKAGTKHGVIVVTSTTGNGDAPENASRFTRFIKRKQSVESQPFQHVTFAVLGLGDTNYDQFCETGKVVDRKLPELGGTRAMPLACADEATGLEDVVEPWIDTILPTMEKACFGNDSSPSTSATAPSVPSVPSATPPAPAAPTTTTATTTTTTTTMTTPPPSAAESPLFILYGSATGNAEQIAKDLASTYEIFLKNPDMNTFFPEVVCCELNQFKKKLLPVIEQEPAPGTKHGVIVVASTTGNGDAPENADRFARFVKRKQSVAQQPFQHVGYSILGLGDTNYDQFCETGKSLDKKMAELGGTRAKPLVCADEATGLEDVVDPWTANVLTDITTFCRGTGQVATATISAKEDYHEEEKKSEGNESDVLPTKPIEPSSGAGVKMLKELLSMEPSMLFPSVSPSMLPNRAASRAKCVMLSEDAVTQLAKKLATQASLTDGDDMEYSLETPYTAKIVGARYLTQTSTDAAAQVASNPSAFDEQFPLTTGNEKNGKRVIEMSLQLPADKSLAYEPGDSIGLVMANESSSVDFVLKLLQDKHSINASAKVSLDGETAMTVEEAIRDKIDLSSTVKNKRLLVSLAEIATNGEEANTLQMLASKDEAANELFEKYVVDQRRTFVDLLKDFPSCQSISLETIFSLLPSIPPRYYSICSSPKQSVDTPSLSVAFSVVDYVTPSMVLGGEEKGQRRIHGLATANLETICAPLLCQADNVNSDSLCVRIFPKPSEYFSLPESTSSPMILIGPGTGIAPFMGFLAHRQAQKAAGQSIGPIDVYFGCRHATHDWLYQDEMKKYVEGGVISNLYTAFSRDSSEKKEYVQDIMAKNTEASERITKLLMTENGSVFICGDGNKMAKDVQETFAKIIGKALPEGNVVQAGKTYIETMKKDGRLKLDIWS